MILPPFPTGAIWCLKIFIEALLIVLLCQRRLAGKYVGLVVYLAVAVGKSITILYYMQHGEYYPAWVRMQWISIAAYAVLTVECLHLMCRHFRGIAIFATALFTGFGTISLLVALAVNKVGIQWWSPDIHRLAGWVKYYGVACVLLMAMARLFFWAYRSQVTMASNVLRVVSGAMALLLASAIGHSVRPWWVSDAFVVGGPLLVFAWLAMRMRESGEDAVLPPPASPEDIARWRRESEEQQRQLTERIRLRMKLG